MQILLVCHAAVEVGMGHLTRLLALAAALESEGGSQSRLLILGDPITNTELDRIDHRFLPLSSNLADAIKSEIEFSQPAVVVFDLHPKMIPSTISELFAWLKDKAIARIGIDSLVDYCCDLDLVWVPSFSTELLQLSKCPGNVRAGWDSFLLRKRLPTPVWHPGNRVLVLTGGSDFTGLGNTLPLLLDQNLPLETEINWVRGPYAKSPHIPDQPRLNWIVHIAPDGLDNLIIQSNYALTLFGVSFFELLQYGVPTVVFSPYAGKDNPELAALATEMVAHVACDAEMAVYGLQSLMADRERSAGLARRAAEKISINGAQQLAKKIHSIVNNSIRKYSV